MRTSEFLFLVSYKSVDDIDDAIDFIYCHIDGLFRDGKFSEVDNVLAKVIDYGVMTFGIGILLAFLTITLAAKSKLARRCDFYDSVQCHFSSFYGHDACHKLLLGLE